MKHHTKVTPSSCFAARAKNVQTLDAAGTGEPGSFRAEATTLADGLWQRVEISATKVSTGETVSISDGHRYTPPANEALLYDLDGNLTEDARWVYTWDAENRMIGAEEKPRSGDLQSPPLPARKRLTFAYDHRHRRIAKTVHEWEGDATTGGFTKLVKDLRFLYDEWNLTLELDHTFATGSGLAGSKGVRACYWGPDLSGTLQGAGGVGGLLAVCTPGGILLPCTDTNGNIKGLVSATETSIGGLTARYDYDPFGNRITDTGPGVELCPFGFSTKYRDEETGIIHYELRDYRPSDGRWMSPDKIGERGFELSRGNEMPMQASEESNLYRMIDNDPINHTDYLGLSIAGQAEWYAKYAAFKTARATWITDPNWQVPFDAWFWETSASLKYTGIGDPRNADIAANAGFRKLLRCTIAKRAGATIPSGRWTVSFNSFQWQYTLTKSDAAGQAAAFTNATKFLGTYTASVRDSGRASAAGKHKYKISISNTSGWTSATRIPGRFGGGSIWTDHRQGDTRYSPKASIGGNLPQTYEFEVEEDYCAKCVLP